MKLKILTAILSLSVLASCAGNMDGHSSRSSVDWPGTYRGTTPCADCPGIDTVVTLKDPDQYDLQTKYLSKSEKVSTASGSFTWDKKGQNITLGNTIYKVGENYLQQLDLEGNEIKGELADKYKLIKISSESPLTETYWKLTELMGNAIPTGSTREGHIILKAAEKRVTGTGGCNRMTGYYDVEEGNHIKFSKIASTMMACVKGMDTDKTLAEALEKADSYMIENNQLHLHQTGVAGALAKFDPVYLY